MRQYLVQSLIALILFFAIVSVKSSSDDFYIPNSLKCGVAAVQLEINTNSSSFQKLLSRAAADEGLIGAVGVFVQNGNCSATIQSAIIPSGTPVFPENDVAAVNYAKCALAIDKIYGANQKLVDYSVTVITRFYAININVSTGRAWIADEAMYVQFPITCTWLAETDSQTTFNTSNNLGPAPPPPPSNQTTQIGSINMTLTGKGLAPGETVEEGTQIMAAINLFSTETYSSIIPRYCYITDSTSKKAWQFLAIDYCPYVGAVGRNGIDSEAYKVNDQSYYFLFDAFTYNDQPTVLLLRCFIRACMTDTHCTAKGIIGRTCWPKAHSAVYRFMNAIATNEFRKKNKRNFLEMLENGPKVANALTMKERQLVVSPRSKVPKDIGMTAQWLLISLLVITLLICLLCSAIFCALAALFLMKRRNGGGQQPYTVDYNQVSVPETVLPSESSSPYKLLPIIPRITSDPSYKY